MSCLEPGKLLTAIVTPFDAQGALALEHVPALLRLQKDAGIDGVVVCGTNGEGPSLSAAERIRLLDTVIRNRDGLGVVAASGAASMEDAVELTRHAADAGADACLVLPPFYFKSPVTEGLEQYFRAVLRAAAIPILLYSIPQITGIEITPALLDRLSDAPNLAGVKDSSGDWDRAARLIEGYPRLRIFVGSDKLAARAYRTGVAGSISGAANAFPELACAAQHAVRSGVPAAEVDSAQARLSELVDVIHRYPAMAVNKTLLAWRGFPRFHVRPPLVDLTPAQESALRAEVAALGLLPA